MDFLSGDGSSPRSRQASCEVHARFLGEKSPINQRLVSELRGAIRRGQKLPGLNEPARVPAKTVLRFKGPPETSRYMKVTGPSGPGAAAAPRGSSSPAASGFSLDGLTGASENTPAARTGGVSSIGSMDALIALQEVGGPLERRRKAVRRAGTILDVLDDLKLGLLDGGVEPGTLDRLVGAVRLERGEADDPRLRELLDEIETRAVVELAKLEMARATN
jgi:hypothetical protein